MKTYKWNSVSPYHYFVQANEEEMRSLARRFQIDLNYFHSGPSKTIQTKEGEQFFFLVDIQEKKVALLPFLSIAFGGQYDDAPIGEEVPYEIDFKEYQLEEFQFRE